MKRFQFICFALVLGVAFSSCDKVKRLEKRLTKKEGKWEISTYHYKYYIDGTLFSEETLNNIGTIEFKDENSGVMTVTVLGMTESSNFTWENTEDMVTMYTTDGDTMTYKVVTDEKKKQEWTYTDEYYDSSADEQVKEETDLELNRMD